MQVGQRVEILVAANRGARWISGKVVAVEPGRGAEFPRFDFRADDGDVFKGVHPLSSRVIVAEAA